MLQRRHKCMAVTHAAAIMPAATKRALDSVGASVQSQGTSANMSVSAAYQ